MRHDRSGPTIHTAKLGVGDKAAEDVRDAAVVGDRRSVVGTDLVQIDRCGAIGVRRAAAHIAEETPVTDDRKPIVVEIVTVFTIPDPDDG